MYDVVAVAERTPDAVLCLISALDFHEIGTQIPSGVSIAIGRKDWRPQLDHPPIHVYRMSGEALTAGVEEHTIDGTAVKVFTRRRRSPIASSSGTRWGSTSPWRLSAKRCTRLGGLPLGPLPRGRRTCGCTCGCSECRRTHHRQERVVV